MQWNGRVYDMAMNWIKLGSNFIKSEFGCHIEILDHIFELFETDSAIEVEVSFDDGSIDKLLELHVGEVVTYHHFEHCEQLTIGNIAVLIDIVNFKSKLKLFLLIITIQRG